MEGKKEKVYGDWVCPGYPAHPEAAKCDHRLGLYRFHLAVSADCSGQFMPDIGTGTRTMGHRCVPSLPGRGYSPITVVCYSCYYCYYCYCEAVPINDRNRRAASSHVAAIGVIGSLREICNVKNHNDVQKFVRGIVTKDFTTRDVKFRVL